MNPFSLLPILGLAVQYAPKLIGFFASPKAGDVAEGVINAVRDVVGTDDPAAAKAKLDADPGLADALKARLDAEVEMHRADLEDVQNARAMQIALSQSNSRIAYTPVVLSYLAVAAAFAATAALFFVRVEIPEKLFQLMQAAYGAIWLVFGIVFQFWLGSSRTSQQKDAQLGAIAASNTSAANARAARR